MKTQNPPKKKLPRKITPKKEKLYPDTWIIDNWKIIKIKNKEHASKFPGNHFFDTYKKALLCREKLAKQFIRTANKSIKSWTRHLNKANGILLLTQEELKNANS